jgi:hypothetical protein
VNYFISAKLISAKKAPKARTPTAHYDDGSDADEPLSGLLTKEKHANLIPAASDSSSDDNEAPPKKISKADDNSSEANSAGN